MHRIAHTSNITSKDPKDGFVVLHNDVKIVGFFYEA